MHARRKEVPMDKGEQSTGLIEQRVITKKERGSRPKECSAVSTPDRWPRGERAIKTKKACMDRCGEEERKRLAINPGEK